MESNISVAVSYFNEKCSVWEPFLEPVDSGKKSAPWNLSVEVSYRLSYDSATGNAFNHHYPTAGNYVHVCICCILCWKIFAKFQFFNSIWILQILSMVIFAAK